MPQTHPFDTVSALSQYSHDNMTAVIHNVHTNILSNARQSFHALYLRFICSLRLLRFHDLHALHMLHAPTRDTMIPMPSYYSSVPSNVLDYFISSFYIFLYHFSVFSFYLMHSRSSSGCLAGSSPALSVCVPDRCRCDFPTRSDDFYFT